MPPQGIAFIAKAERKSKKKMANDLMAQGIGRFYEEKIHECNKQCIAARELGQEPELTRFIIMLRRLVNHRANISTISSGNIVKWREASFFLDFDDFPAMIEYKRISIAALGTNEPLPANGLISRKLVKSGQGTG